MIEFIVVGIGGFIGSCLRFTFTKVFKYFGIMFPFGTLVSNALAGFLIGFIIVCEMQSSLISPKMKLFLTTGFLGGLSTFSTFSLETVNFFNNENYFLGICNLFLNLGLSILGVVLGMAIAKVAYKQGVSQ